MASEPMRDDRQDWYDPSEPTLTFASSDDMIAWLQSDDDDDARDQRDAEERVVD